MASPTHDDEPEITARPTERPLAEPDDEVVPLANVGGAAPTPGGDSGGNLPGPEDDLGSIYAGEPEAAPEFAAVRVHEEDEEDPP